MARACGSVGRSWMMEVVSREGIVALESVAVAEQHYVLSLVKYLMHSGRSYH